ncbi:MAG: tripartite tricarboxylate transporter substrate binding protein [Proteobacteria bacterium]|nr:tripartite tricarboxylate transporter substrate binding protein [Pseudomonadota bacterium]
MKALSRFAVAIAAGVLALAPTIASAQAWPTKSIRIINPFPAGGGTDTFARPLAAKLTQALGQTVYIENQGGAGGTVGASNASKAAPDGYTFFMGAIHHTIGESLYTTLPYKLERDFIPITVVAYVPQVMVVHPKHPFKTIKELVDYAKANPGKLNFGSPGSGTSHHLAMELFLNVTGTKMTHVPYKGAGPMMTDFLAGTIDVVFDGMGTSSTQMKAGKLRGLAIATPKRAEQFPDMPTMDEVGVPGMVVSTWYALWAIKGTPKEAVDRMYQETVKAMNLTDMKNIWVSQVATTGGISPEEFQAFIRSEIVRWSKVVKDANVKVDL